MFRISPADFEATSAKIRKINDRAKKRGFTGSITLTAERVEVASKDDYGFDRVDVWFDVELTGEPPRYNGWTFVATLDWDEHAGLIVRTAPGADPIDRSSLNQGFCDHCKTNRQRNNTYLVHNDETGQQLQVGSTCIKDFLGWDASVVFVDEDSVASDLGLGYGNGASDCVGTLYALSVAWALIKMDGYKPASSYGSTTKGDLADVLWPPRLLSAERRADLAGIQDLAAAATEQAAKCRAWVLSDDFNGPSDYVANLKAVVAAEYVTGRNIGLLASAPQAWAKWQQRTLVREATKVESNWIGQPGQRITFTATVNAINFFPGDWGTTVLYSMRDEVGNIIKWFASSEALGDVVGKQVTLKATIKALDTYQDIKQTVVTRAKEMAS